MNIVAAIKNGDDFVFQQVFNEYHKRLYFYVFSKTKSEYLAEEVVQITFIKFWNYRASLKEELSVYTQLFRIATTTLIDLLRKQNNASILINQLSKSESHKQENYTRETIDLNETKKQLLAALEKMPPMRRKVFEMSRLEGLTYNEIAARLSISPKTVENHIALAIKNIRQVIFIISIVIIENVPVYFLFHWGYCYT